MAVGHAIIMSSWLYAIPLYGNEKCLWNVYVSYVKWHGISEPWQIWSSVSGFSWNEINISAVRLRLHVTYTNTDILLCARWRLVNEFVAFDWRWCLLVMDEGETTVRWKWQLSVKWFQGLSGTTLKLRGAGWYGYSHESIAITLLSRKEPRMSPLENHIAFKNFFFALALIH